MVYIEALFSATAARISASRFSSKPLFLSCALTVWTLSSATAARILSSVARLSAAGNAALEVLSPKVRSLRSLRVIHFFDSIFWAVLVRGGCSVKSIKRATCKWITLFKKNLVIHIGFEVQPSVAWVSITILGPLTILSKR